MAIAVGQKTAKGDGSAVASLTTDAVTTAASGSTFVVGLSWYQGVNFGTLVDSKGNTYVQIGTEQTTTGELDTRLYYCENGTGGSGHTVTFTPSGSAACNVYFLEITGGLTSGILDKTAQAIDTSSPFATGATDTTTQNNELLVGFIAANSGSNPASHGISGGNPSSGWTVQCEVTDGTTYWTGALMTTTVSATGAYNFSATESGASAASVFIATFKESGGAVSNAPRSAAYYRMMRNR